MNTTSDPFSHHPELREKIADPLQSFSRTLTTKFIAEKTRELGLTPNWWYSDNDRETLRAEALVGHMDQDLWVFGYGSLMWDPAIRFSEVRRAHLPGYSRQFILKDIYGGRGTEDAPGVMAALDKGAGCDGLLFKINQKNVDEETEVLWRREQIGPAYIPTFVETIVADQPITALTFVADHDSILIDANMTRDEQIHYFATGTGFMGTSLEYLENVNAQFKTLGIVDEDAKALLHEIQEYMRTR
ncbi:MAG: gamma-glutamylcyclotransferase [Rhizobiales bacterium]|nr:gamma-glutamylcyclotransferase [Hyphomicrobiales bacterium]